MTNGSKWLLHFKVLGVIAVVVGAVAVMLLSSSHGRGLDGLGVALAGGFLLLGLVAHAVLSTIVVALSADRRGVAFAHMAAPLVFVLVSTAFVVVE